MADLPPDSSTPDGIDVEVQHASHSLAPDRCRSVLSRVIDGEDVQLGHVTLVLADHATVLELNQTYLDHDFVTDVLSFDYSEESGLVEGEIYVDLDTAEERCAEFDASFEEEALRYVVHGMLHLIGYDDATPDGKDRMRALEDRYLRDPSAA